MTIRLYQQDPYLKKCISKVINIISDGNDTILELDQTIFFPVGGGQPCDFGFIGIYPVIAVFEKDGIVYHQIEIEERDNLHLGDQMVCLLDWERRFSHMQSHCGEHILSGVFARAYHGMNKGFHMGSESMTIDIDIKSISAEMLAYAELEANKVIWNNVPVSVRFFKDAKEAEHLPLRKPLVLEEDISIVCVGDENNPADCVACCGTHPNTSGEVGLIKILKAEHYKGMTRIYFKAGQDALADYQEKHQTITNLCERFSAEPSSLAKRIEGQEEKIQLLKSELFELRQNWLKGEIDTFKKVETAVVSVTYPFAGKTELQKLAQTLLRENPNVKLFIGASHSECAVVVASAEESKIHCGNLTKELCSRFHGKGGGSKTLAGAKFESDKDLYQFIDALTASELALL